MGSRTNRTRQNNKKNRKNRWNKRGPHFAGGGDRRQSVALYRPVPSPLEGESDPDQSLFSAEARQRLPEVLGRQADAIIRALNLVELGEFERAHNELKEIPRISPFADWRMLVRGLTAWYENNFLSATEAWSRLDPNRRPARIAAVLIATVNWSDSKAQTESAALSGETAAAVFLARANLKMIELVRRVYDHRPALQLARQMAAVKHRDPETKLSASQIAMLGDLRGKFADHEPVLIKQISDACIGLAFQQPQPDLFSLLTKRLPGPVHDPAWNLAQSEYLENFSGAEAVRAAAIRRYLDVDLANTTSIPEDLRQALCSSIWQQIGEELLKANGPFQDYRTSGIKVASKAFERSAEAWPQNRDAYEGLIECIIKPTEMRGRLSPKKGQLEVIDREVARVRERWIKASPDEVEPRLWLIDHYLQCGNTTRAGELIDSLAQNRLESPRLKMLPWKVCLFEALAITKKKREIDRAKAALDRAATIWPTWLSRDLFRFLEAGLELRAGDTDAFLKMRQAAIETTGLPELVGDVMTLAALQMVNLPSNELKPFRALVDEHVKNIDSLPTEDLAKLGSFFWDLMLTGLSYPAWRMHGSKFGEDLCFRLVEHPPQSAIPGLIEACLWMSNAQFYSNDSYDPRWPNWLFNQAKTDALAAAAVLRVYRVNRYASRRIAALDGLLKLVETASKAESSPVKRMVLEETAATAYKILDENSILNPFAWAFGNPFQTSGLPGLFDDEENDWDEVDDVEDEFGMDKYGFVDYEPTCKCPDCESVRQRSQAERMADGNWFGGDEPAFSMDDEVSLQAQLFLERMGPDGIERMDQIMDEGRFTGRDVLAEAIAFVESKGVSREEFMSVLAESRKTGKKRTDQPKMTAEEKRQFRRKRKSPMEKKKQRR